MSLCIYSAVFTVLRKFFHAYRRRVVVPTALLVPLAVLGGGGPWLWEVAVDLVAEG